MVVGKGRAMRAWILLGGSVCALVALITAELAGFAAPQAPPSRDMAWAPPGQGTASPGIARESPERLAATALARPLFAPSRRPPPPGGATPVTAETAAPPRLTGTIVGGLGPRAAILVPPDSERPVVLHEGERAGRFTVVRIAPGQIEASGPNGAVRLQLGAGRPALPPALPEPAPIPENPRNRLPTEQDE